MPESSVQEAVLRLARQLKLIPTAPPGNPGPAYHPGPEWPVQSLSDAATVPAQFFGELLRGLMDPLGANNQAPVENIGALLGAAMPLAGGLRGLRAGQLAEEAATAGRAAKGAQGIKAYHGSPHDFDQFQMSKIGTGEGAQAYGHGLYFAENEKTALDYRNRLTDATAPVTDVLFRGQSMPNGTPEQHAAKLLSESGAGRREMLAWAKRTAQEAATGADAGMEDIGRKAGMTGREYYQRLYDFMQNASKRDIQVKRGRMYEVSINADKGQFLDLDKPLASQPEAVKEALRKAGIDKDFRSNLSDYGSPMETRGAGRGKNLVAYLEHAARKSGVSAEDAAAKASERLREIGIPGAQYLDAGSRSAARGTRNFVVFDEALVSILKKYGVALPAIEVLRRKAQANNGTVPANDVHSLIGS